MDGMDRTPPLVRPGLQGNPLFPRLCTGNLTAAMASGDETAEVNNVEPMCGASPVESGNDTLEVTNRFGWKAEAGAFCLFGWHETKEEWMLIQIIGCWE